MKDVYTREIVAVHESKLLEEELDSQIAPSFVWQFPLSFGVRRGRAQLVRVPITASPVQSGL